MFLVHGEWEISVKGNYILQTFSGDWNEEAAIEYSKDFFSKVNHLTSTSNANSWAIISCLNNWGLATPEAEQHLTTHMQRLKDLGCAKHAQIFLPSVVKSMQLDRICSQNNASYERKWFEDKTQATAWLESQGYLVELGDKKANLSVA